MIKYEVDLDEVKHLFIKKLPREIVDKIYIWAAKIEIDGLPKTRKISGFHDELLKGNRYGQRSVRLNKAYRLFYIGVNKHEY